MCLTLLPQVLGDSALNISHISPFICFLQPKPLPGDMAMNKPLPRSHTHVVNNAYPVMWKPHAKFLHGWFLIKLLIPK